MYKDLNNSKQVDYPYFPFRLPVDYVLVSRTNNLSRQVYRNFFEKACIKEGLIVNHEIKGSLCFTLISTPFHRLCRECEKTQMSFPLRDCIVEPGLPSCCISLSKVFVSDDTVNYISAPFQRRIAHLFLNYTNEKLFFTSAQRAILTHQILTQIDINQEIEVQEIENSRKTSPKDVEVSVIMEETLKRRGLDYLLLENVYDDAYILHDPSEIEPYFRKIRENSLVNFLEAVSEIEDDPRKRLSETWTRFHKLQPLNMIREYFGEQIAFYFAWHGTFITLLWPAAILGLAVIGYGIAKNIRDEPMRILNCTSLNFAGEEITVPCQHQNHGHRLFTTIWTWFMKSFDNELNAFYAAFISIWGSVFYQIWQRNSSVLAYRWDTDDYHQMEPDRPEYIGKELREDPLTGEPEWITPNVARYIKMIVSAIVVGFFMLIVVVSVFCVTVYKLWAINLHTCKSEFTLECSLLTTFLPSILNTLSTMLLGFIYGEVVAKLNNWENHRTYSEHNNALIVKIFAFQLINNYTSLFYIAFIRPESHGFQKNGLFGLGDQYKDTCLDSACGMLLAVQLITNLLIKPFPKFVKDIIIPFFILLYRKAKVSRSEVNEDEKANDEANVLMREWMKPDAGDFALWEFNEKIILFGTTMMFAALFPLAPLISLIIGLVDLRIDAHRLLWFNRRPIPEVSHGIGIWSPILVFLQYAAVMTNAFIIAFTSDFCVNFLSSEKCDIQDRLVIVIVFQNTIFVLKYLMQCVVPKIPAAIRVAQRKKKYIVSHIIEKGDIPRKTRLRKQARRAKIAWITSKVSAASNSTIAESGEQKDNI